MEDHPASSPVRVNCSLGVVDYAPPPHYGRQTIDLFGQDLYMPSNVSEEGLGPERRFAFKKKQYDMEI